MASVEIQVPVIYIDIYYAYQIWQMSISWQWMLEEELGGILAFFGGNDYLQVKSGWVLGVTKPFFPDHGRLDDCARCLVLKSTAQPNNRDVEDS